MLTCFDCGTVVSRVHNMLRTIARIRNLTNAVPQTKSSGFVDPSASPEQNLTGTGWSGVKQGAPSARQVQRTIPAATCPRTDRCDRVNATNTGNDFDPWWQSAYGAAGRRASAERETVMENDQRANDASTPWSCAPQWDTEEAMAEVKGCALCVVLDVNVLTSMQLRSNVVHLQDLHDFDDEGELYRNYMRRFNNLVVAGGVELEKILKIDLDGDGQV